MIKKILLRATSIFLTIVLVLGMMSPALLLWPERANAATTLSAGDIAVLGFNADSTFPNQTWAFVPLVNISSGTVINFTDASFDGSISTGNQFYVNSLNEGHMTWTVPSNISAGTTFIVTNNSGSNATIRDINSNSYAGVSGSVGGSSYGFATTGDQIIVYQGTAGTTVGATFICAFNNGQNSTAYPVNGSWMTTGTATGYQHVSYLPTGLTNGTSAIALTAHAAGSSGIYGFDNMKYNGTTSGTKADLLAAIGNPSNWVGHDSTPYDFSQIGNFTITGSNTAPTASNVSISGTAQVGQTLTGSYDYSDANGDLQGTSTFKWYRFDDAGGTNETEISGATSTTYSLVEADLGKYISFEVTPVALTGTSPGSAAESRRIGAVTANSTYTVTYNGNGNTGGNVPTDSGTYAQGATVTVLGNTGNLVKTGHTFVGWNTAADGNGTDYTVGAIPSTFTMGTADVTLYAKWTENQTPTYTVTYDGNTNTGGSVPTDSGTYAQGATVTVLGNTGNLVKTGHTFAGWNTAVNGSGTDYTVGAIPSTFTMGTADVTLYAKWTLNSYTVTFNKNGGDTDASPGSKTANYGGNVGTLPTAPSKTGYTFAGWNTAANGSGTSFIATTAVTGNITVYAQWTINSYTVTFNKNGGDTEASPGTKTANYGGNVGTLPTAPTRVGHTFAGWNTAADGTGTSFVATTAVTGNITVYAQWTINSYTVTFNKNGGDTEASPGTKTATYGGNVGTLPTALGKTGYTFAGWNTAADGSGSSFVATTAVTGNITVYAQWTLNTYTVTFDKNGGDTETNPGSKTASYGGNVGTLPTEPTKTSSTFAGWNTAADGSGTSFIATTAVTGNITVYAQWTLNSYTVTFDKNGGDTEASPGTKTASYGGNIGTLPAEPTRTGYTFAGWNTAADGTGSTFDAETEVTGNITVYAQWTLNSYTVTFNKNGGDTEANPGTKTANYGGNVGTLPTAPGKTGDTFAGWNTATDGSGTSFAATTAVTGNITVYAQWTINSYTVTFNSNGGSTVDSQSVNYGGHATEPAAPTKTGYTFAGWYTDNTYATPFDFANTAITRDTTVYAKWTANPSNDGGGDSGASSGGTPTVTVKGDVVDNTTGQPVKGITAQVATEANGTKTVTVKSQDAILVKESDGTRTPLSDIAKLGFAAKESTDAKVTLSADGTIQVKNLANGTESKFAVTFDLGNGKTINIGSLAIKVGSSGEVSLTSTLIDPYGIITDPATGKPIAGANVTLYYADTERNKAAGKTPHTIVPLPILDGFEPNNNQNPQSSDAGGAYAFMVFPTTDYYLVATKDGYEPYKSPTISVELDIVKWDFKMNKSITGVNRLAGLNRIDTAIEIAKANYTAKVSSVILATAENYPDALTGSVLAYKLNAPILLVGSSDEDQEKILAYMKSNLDFAGTVYILGGTVAVSSEMEAKVTGSGFKNITRLGGYDRYETAIKIAEYLDVPQGRPVVLVYGENYPDALSISSSAAAIQSPIFLVQKDGISDAVKQEIAKIKPIKVYIIGLQGVISSEVENQVAQITSLDKANIVRIGGVDRFETSLEVAKYFNLSGQNVCVATGNIFPDALAGSVYAANFNAPILLVDGNLSDNAMAYLKTRIITGATIFGGEAVVRKDIEEKLSQIIGK